MGYYADHWVALDTPGYMIKLRAGSVVVAQGAFEQPAVFRNNDLPGVMHASGAQRLLHRYAVAPATRLVVVTANVDGYRAALDALAAGIELRAVLDLRETRGRTSAPLAETLRTRGVSVHHGAAVESERLADAADLIGEGDLQRVPGIVGIFHHLGDFELRAGPGPVPDA